MIVIDAAEGKELRRFGQTVADRSYGIDAVAISADGKTVVSVCHVNQDLSIITLWETESGRERGSLVGQIGPIRQVAIAADGRFLVTAGDDATALVWDATMRQPTGGFDRAMCLADLAGEDAEQAYASLWALINAPDKAVALLGKQRALFARPDVRAIQQWIDDLDSDVFTLRERAFGELQPIADEVEPDLQKALASNRTSLEARRRIERLLLERHAELYKFRVIEVLERIADAGAVALLRRFAAGTPELRTTQESRASLKRLAQRAGSVSDG
jgi:hypothetical protein